MRKTSGFYEKFVSKSLKVESNFSEEESKLLRKESKLLRKESKLLKKEAKFNVFALFSNEIMPVFNGNTFIFNSNSELSFANIDILWRAYQKGTYPDILIRICNREMLAGLEGSLRSGRFLTEIKMAPRALPYSYLG